MNQKIHPIQAELLKIALGEGLERFTLDDLAQITGLKSRQAVWHHLTQLEKRGFINPISKRATQSTSNRTFRSIPVLGLADCGKPNKIAEEDVRGYIRVSAGFANHKQKELFSVRAAGDSMNKAVVPCRSGGRKPIEDGDYVIIDPSIMRPDNGDYVLSVINGAANIKRFYRDKEKIMLISESNIDYPPIIIHPDDIRDYMVNGKVIDVIKRLNPNTQRGGG